MISRGAAGLCWHDTNHLPHVHLARRLPGGARPGPRDPIGVGGLALHQWHLAEPLHEADARPATTMRPSGAYVMGRNMFGPIRGEWDGDWRGWWGEEPPYHAPVFVLTHYAHEPIEMEGGTTFHFVTEGFEVAFDAAREAAGDLEVTSPAAPRPCVKPLRRA